MGRTKWLSWSEASEREEERLGESQALDSTISKVFHTLHSLAAQLEDKVCQHLHGERLEREAMVEKAEHTLHQKIDALREEQHKLGASLDVERETRKREVERLDSACCGRSRVEARRCSSTEEDVVKERAEHLAQMDVLYRQAVALSQEAQRRSQALVLAEELDRQLDTQIEVCRTAVATLHSNLKEQVCSANDVCRKPGSRAAELAPILSQVQVLEPHLRGIVDLERLIERSEQLQGDAQGFMRTLRSGEVPAARPTRQWNASTRSGSLGRPVVGSVEIPAPGDSWPRARGRPLHDLQLQTGLTGIVSQLDNLFPDTGSSRVVMGSAVTQRSQSPRSTLTVVQQVEERHGQIHKTDKLVTTLPERRHVLCRAPPPRSPAQPSGRLCTMGG